MSLTYSVYNCIEIVSNPFQNLHSEKGWGNTRQSLVWEGTEGSLHWQCSSFLLDHLLMARFVFWQELPF